MEADWKQRVKKLSLLYRILICIREALSFSCSINKLSKRICAQLEKKAATNARGKRFHLLKEAEKADKVAKPFFLGVLKQNARQIQKEGGWSPVLYKIEKAGQTGYLFGTIHLGTSSMKNIPKRITSIVDKCDVICPEIDITDHNKILQSQSALSYETTQHPITDSEEAVRQLAEIAPRRARLYHWLNRDTLENNPNLANSTRQLAETAMQKEAQAHLDRGVEMQLLPYAKKKRLPLHDIETPEEQAKTIAKHRKKTFYKMDYSRSLTGRRKPSEELLSVLDAWQTGNEKVLEAMCATTDGENLLLSSERHETMVKRIEEVLAKYKPFIAIGAAHLIGKGSVVERLQDKGYTLTRI